MSLQKKEPIFVREQVASDNNFCIKRLNVYYPKQRRKVACNFRSMSLLLSEGYSGMAVFFQLLLFEQTKTTHLEILISSTLLFLKFHDIFVPITDFLRVARHKSDQLYV